MRTVLLSLALLSLCVQAGEIYRWVDENGKTHVSDVVPEKYRQSARRISTGQDPSPEARREAEERARVEREQANRRAADPASAAATQPPAVAPATAEPECERAHRLYKESVDCFAPFVNANGTVRAEAFQRCPSVPDPSPRCGPPKAESSQRTY